MAELELSFEKANEHGQEVGVKVVGEMGQHQTEERKHSAGRQHRFASHEQEMSVASMTSGHKVNTKESREKCLQLLQNERDAEDSSGR